MNFTDRKDEAEGLVLEFLSDYTAPRGMDEGQLSKRVSNIADAFARRMPIGGDYVEKIHGVLARIRDTHESNTWPTQAVFVAAMPSGEIRKGAPASYKSDDEDRVPKLMAQGYGVPERDIWRNQHCDPEVLDRYRRASVDNWRDVYRSEAETLMADKYGPVVCQYFMDAP
jgi:hypothetical protein